jgi:hypothetical protein
LAPELIDAPTAIAGSSWSGTPAPFAVIRTDAQGTELVDRARIVGCRQASS